MEDALVPVFLEQCLDVGHDEAQHGALDAGPFLRIVPLQVQLDPVAPQSGVSRIAGGIGEGEFETQPPDVEADRRGDVPRREHGLYRLEAGRPTLPRYR